MSSSRESIVGSVWALMLLLLSGLAGGKSAAIAPFDSCDTHGAYTDRLCQGDDLNTSEYLESSNGDYRFYFQSDGHLLVYDVSDWENWDHVCSVYPPHEDPGWFFYGDEDSPGGPGESNTVLRNSSYVAIASVLWSASPDGVHFLRLENNGQLKVWDQDGGRLINTMGCS